MSDWVEVWIDSEEGDSLLVVKSSQDGGLEIVDPQEKNKLVAQFGAYEDAVHWLVSDQYMLVSGRMQREK